MIILDTPPDLETGARLLDVLYHIRELDERALVQIVYFLSVSLERTIAENKELKEKVRVIENALNNHGLLK